MGCDVETISNNGAIVERLGSRDISIVQRSDWTMPENVQRQYTVRPTRFYWSAEVSIQYFRLGFGDATIEKISHVRYNNSAVWLYSTGSIFEIDIIVFPGVWNLENSGGVWTISEGKYFWFLLGTSEYLMRENFCYWDDWMINEVDICFGDERNITP